MTRAMKKTIIQEQLPKYLKASLTEKTAILDSVCRISGIGRKSAIRAFGRERGRSGWKAPPKIGRPKYYTTETEAALAFVWEQYEYPCAERLVDEVPEAIRIFQRDGMWDYSQVATEQLLNMSLGAMKVRTVAAAKQRGLMRGISTTSAAKHPSLFWLLGSQRCRTRPIGHCSTQRAKAHGYHGVHRQLHRCCYLLAGDGGSVKQE